LTTNKKTKLRVTIFLGLCSLLAAHLCFWILPNVFEIWNSQAIDQLFVLRSSSKKLRPAYNNTIAHIDLNNTSIKRLENLYLNRSYFARVTRNLTSMGVSAQVYDFIFAARLDEVNDRALIEATHEAGNVYFGLAFELRHEDQLSKRKKEPQDAIAYLDRSKWLVNVQGDPPTFYVGTNPLATFSELALASKGLGSLSIKFDRDGVLRRVPLIVRYGGGFYPILPFRVICDYLKVPPEKIVVRPGKNITLQDAQRPGEEEFQDVVIPIDRQGNMLVNYIGPWGEMDHYNFADILLASDDRVELEMWAEELKGKIVVISDISTGSTDVGPVPTDANFPLSGVHANIMHQILTKSFLRELSEAKMLLVEALLLSIVLFFSVRFSSIHFSLGTLLLAGLYVGTACAVFFYGSLIFHMVRPMLMIVFAVISIVVYRYIHEEREKMESLRQRDFIRQTFGRYLSREVVEELLSSPGALELGGESREVTFLVSDLRGFTALTMKLPPQEVINILNRFLGRMVEVIRQYRGTLNEIEGDGILTFFGAPLVSEDDHERAVACAIEMQNAMAEVNAEQEKLGLPELAMGIGLNTGEVVVGNIGSEARAKYSAIGSTINTAYRVESYTVGGQILISPTTYEKLKPLVRVRSKMEVQFKGIDHPITLYDVVGMGGKYQIALLENEVPPLSEIKPPIPIACLSLEGKMVLETSVSGYITHFGGSAADVSLKQPLEVRSNLKILLVSEEASGLSEGYAKVMSLDASDSKSSTFEARLEFTWLPDDVKTFIQSFCYQ
jgi:adenylate cyclase